MADLKKNGLSNWSGESSRKTLSSFCQTLKSPVVSFASLTISANGRAYGAAGAPGRAAPGASACDAAPGGSSRSADGATSASSPALAPSPRDRLAQPDITSGAGEPGAVAARGKRG